MAADMSYFKIGATFGIVLKSVRLDRNICLYICLDVDYIDVYTIVCQRDPERILKNVQIAKLA